MKDLKIIVVAPTGRDGQLICNLLERAGLEAVAVDDCDAACGEAKSGVGALVLAEEALDAAGIRALGGFLSQQPTWSNLPLVVLTGSGHATFLSETRRKAREPLGNITPVERPMRPDTLVSVAQSALRARKRQYEVREHLRLEGLAADALRKSEKLAIVGRLAATIAHEVNNPLQAVANLHYLMASASTFDEAKGYLTLAVQELARTAEITTQVLGFHRDNSSPADVRVADIFDSVLKLYARKLGGSQILVDVCFDRSALILGFAGELRQLFANLVSNAADAMPNGGRLKVRVLSSFERSNGLRRGVRVVVADTGIGIPVGIRDKIFDAFVSTKDATGTGLGLWVSSEIIRRHSGALRFRSRLDTGTVFSIFLPFRPSIGVTEHEVSEAATEDSGVGRLQPIAQAP